MTIFIEGALIGAFLLYFFVHPILEGYVLRQRERERQIRYADTMSKLFGAPKG